MKISDKVQWTNGVGVVLTGTVVYPPVEPNGRPLVRTENGNRIRPINAEVIEEAGEYPICYEIGTLTVTDFGTGEVHVTSPKGSTVRITDDNGLVVTSNWGMVVSQRNSVPAVWIP